MKIHHHLRKIPLVGKLFRTHHTESLQIKINTSDLIEVCQEIYGSVHRLNIDPQSLPMFMGAVYSRVLHDSGYHACSKLVLEFARSVYKENKCHDCFAEFCDKWELGRHPEEDPEKVIRFRGKRS